MTNTDTAIETSIARQLFACATAVGTSNHKRASLIHLPTWHRWLTNHQTLVAPGAPTAALLERMLATINSYYGVFSHANTWRLRQHIYHKELGSLQRFFLPDGPAYLHLRIRKIWCT